MKKSLFNIAAAFSAVAAGKNFSNNNRAVMTTVGVFKK